jgi:predicted ATPase
VGPRWYSRHTVAEWTLRVQDFRGLQTVEWSPSGVCLLAGPNGSGKSSVLEALTFLRTASRRGLVEALRLAGAIEYVRRLGAEPKASVVLSLSAKGVGWEVRLPIFHGGPGWPGEKLIAHGKVLAERSSLSNEVTLEGEPSLKDERSVLAMYASQPGRSDDWVGGPLLQRLQTMGVYRGYRLDLIRSPQTTSNFSDDQLDPQGANLWVVLRAWKAASRKYRGQVEWVLAQLKRAFPDLVEDIDFEELGGLVFGHFYPANAPSANARLPLSVAADGFLVGLLHLTAVAGAKEGSILAFDEVENQLHPHAIRSILAAMRERAEERDLTIILTTHSPVVMNAFKGHEGQFFVLEPGRERLPVPLDEARDPEWLAHFSLGDLYEREEFAAPTAAANEAL